MSRETAILSICSMSFVPANIRSRSLLLGCIGNHHSHRLPRDCDLLQLARGFLCHLIRCRYVALGTLELVHEVPGRLENLGEVVHVVVYPGLLLRSLLR